MLDPYGLPTLLMQLIPGQSLLGVEDPNEVRELAAPTMPFKRPAAVEATSATAEVAADLADDTTEEAAEDALLATFSAATMGEVTAETIAVVVAAAGSEAAGAVGLESPP